MDECIFCKIVNKEIKSYIIYEDNVAMAFLDINPLTKGHLLIIPKKHYERLSQIPEEEMKEFSKSVLKILKLVEEKLTKDYNILVNNGKKAGQEIFHAHIHIIPRYGEEKLFNWTTHKLTEEEANEILRKFKS